MWSTFQESNTPLNLILIAVERNLGSANDQRILSVLTFAGLREIPKRSGFWQAAMAFRFQRATRLFVRMNEEPNNAKLFIEADQP